eukprot:TRINITY_DN2828_c0_g1_i2.p1 TRINITY_DN2828_c0_g1~~TRINITY_DN2828_c0_g1_i2.p1  ORF type:complete len:1144 (-),score=267.61 TRINITY_DN2828_c0_g1_i2:1811-5242(-)
MDMLGDENMSHLHIEPVHDIVANTIVLGGIDTQFGDNEEESEERQVVLRQSDPYDCAALCMIFQSTGGPTTWKSTTGWTREDFGTSCCDVGALGVTCDSNGRVTQLSLRGNGLTGFLPVEIGALKKLQHLDLSLGLIGDEIPAELGDLTELITVILEGNEFIGEVPPSIRNLKKLQYLSIATCDLDYLPDEIGDLESLHTLLLSTNQLKGGLPDHIGNLKRLKILDISSNHFNGSLPASICELTALEDIRLGFNNFQGNFQTCFTLMQNLTSLDIRSNQFSGELPKEIGDFESLSYLDISHNLFNGKIPKEIGKLSKVEKLKLYSNLFEGNIPKEIGNCLSLHHIFLNSNRLNGTVPEEIANLKSLEILVLSGNEISGPFPNVSSSPNLVGIEMQGNQISDFSWRSIPASLQFLSLAENSLRTIQPEPANAVLSVAEFSGNADLVIDADSLTPPSSVISLSSVREITSNDTSDGFMGDKIMSSSLELMDTKVSQFFRSQSKLYPFLRILRMKGSLIAKVKDDLPESERDFIQRIRQDIPFLTELDISENPAIVGTTNDFTNMKYLKYLTLSGTNVAGKFGGPLDIRIDSSTTHPIDNHGLCFDFTGRNSLHLEIEDTNFGYEHCFCIVGFFKMPPYCTKCFDHAICNNVDESSLGLDARKVNGRIVAMKGYWATPSYSLEEMDSGKYPTEIIPCRGVGTSDTPCDDNGMGDLCKDGYRGRKCDTCAPNWYRVYPECFECPGVVGMIFSTIGTVAGWIGLFIIAYILGNRGNAILKILLFYVQGLNLIRPPMPTYGQRVDDFFNETFRIGMMGMECLFGGGYHVHREYILSLLTPVLCIVMVGLIYGIGSLVIRCMPRKEEKMKKQSSIEDYSCQEEDDETMESKDTIERGKSSIGWGQRNLRALIFLLYFGYMGTSQAVLFPLVCEKDPGTNEYYMINATAERCSKSLQMSSSVLLVLYVLLLPLIALFVIWKTYDNSRQSGVLGILVAGYPKKFRFWEIYITVRRVLFLCAFFLFREASETRIAWAIFVLVLSIILQFVYRPYGSKFENICEIVSLGLLLGDLGMWLAHQRGQSFHEDDSIDVVSMIVNGLFLSILCVRSAMSISVDAKRLFLTFFPSCCSKKKSQELQDESLEKPLVRSSS